MEPSKPEPAHRAQAMGLQSRTRHEHRFSDPEAPLSASRVPGTASHTTYFPSNLNMMDTIRAYVSELLVHFGLYNPPPLAVCTTDTVWLLDNVAFCRSDEFADGWQAEVVAAVFAQRPPANPNLISRASLVAAQLGLTEADQKELHVVLERLLPFDMEIRPGRTVEVDWNGQKQVLLGPCDGSGISTDLVRDLPAATAGTVMVSAARVPSGVTGLLTMKTVYVHEQGWAVISDIDDTIKVTQTSDLTGILRSTFLDEPTPIAGMPELYAYIHSLVQPSSPFFYLSASPYNLYPFLRGFRDKHFPHGQLMLRDASWMSLRGLLSCLTIGTFDYKTERMDKIHGWLPRRTMICLGDSTQSDPEVYGEMYRRYPGWVRVIFIRRVVDIAAVGIGEKNEPARFERAFEGLPRDVWHVFEYPQECYDIIRRAVQG